MISRTLNYLRSNLLALVALFVALGGTAYAANTIGSTDIIDGEVKTPDLAAAAVTGAKLDDNAIKAKHIANGQVKSLDIGKGAVQGDDVLNDTLTGTDIDESTLAVGTAASDSSACNADSADAVCAETSIDVPGPSALLIDAVGQWYAFAFDDLTGPGSESDDPYLVEGQCEIRVDNVPIGFPIEVGERAVVAGGRVHGAFSPASIALSATRLVNGGSVDVSVVCRELDGDIDWSQMDVNVLAVPTVPQPPDLGTKDARGGADDPPAEPKKSE